MLLSVALVVAGILSMIVATILMPPFLLLAVGSLLVAVGLFRNDQHENEADR